MLLLLLIAIWILIAFALIAGLCIAARAGELQTDRPTSLTRPESVHRSGRRGVDHTSAPNPAGLPIRPH
jgi:hypothetical protein